MFLDEFDHAVTRFNGENTGYSHETKTNSIRAVFDQIGCDIQPNIPDVFDSILRVHGLNCRCLRC
jgi:hypothetical protein